MDKQILEDLGATEYYYTSPHPNGPATNTDTDVYVYQVLIGITREKAKAAVAKWVLDNNHRLLSRPRQ